MTYAELGRFEEAIQLQYKALEASSAAGADAATLERLRQNLNLFETGKPVRMR